METETLYREHILDHHYRPRNYGAMIEFDATAKGANLLCGDALEVWLKLDGDRIAEVSFTQDGCIINRAASSIASEYVRGRTKGELLAMSGADVIAALGIPLSPGRIKCGTLFFDTLRKLFAS